MQPTTKTHMPHEFYEHEKWEVIQELKNVNLELNKQLKKKNFEIKELEHDKLLLERKNKSSTR